jgi:hypothetical protein
VTTDTSRRAVLAGAVAVAASTAAVALPTELRTSETDPVFAAIENHKLVYAEWLEAVRSLDVLEENVPNSYQLLNPSIDVPVFESRDDIAVRSTDEVTIKSCWTEEEIAECVPEFFTEGERKKFLRKYGVALKREATKCERAAEAHGLAGAKRRHDTAQKKYNEATTVVALTIPETTEGARSAMEYWWRHIQDYYGPSETMDDGLKETLRFMTSLWSALGNFQIAQLHA